MCVGVCLCVQYTVGRFFFPPMKGKLASEPGDRGLTLSVDFLWSQLPEALLPSMRVLQLPPKLPVCRPVSPTPPPPTAKNNEPKVRV